VTEHDIGRRCLCRNCKTEFILTEFIPPIESTRPLPEEGPRLEEKKTRPEVNLARFNESKKAKKDSFKVVSIVFNIVLLALLAFVYKLYVDKSSNYEEQLSGLNKKYDILQKKFNSEQKKAGENKDSNVDKIKELKEIHNNLAKDIEFYSKEITQFDPTTIYYKLSASVLSENKLLDYLILEQISALETGAKVNFVSNQSQPNPDLAAKLGAEIESQTKEIAVLEGQINDQIDASTKSAKELTIQSKKLILSILTRNFLIAKYGLNVPYINIDDIGKEINGELNQSS
jgi:uncharacterized membrane protein YgaE (UPF0421/DUF939 family)